jgi:putative oxidoreductase
MEIGLLVIRLAIGLTLAAHGAQKLFGAFGGYGLAGTGGFMETLGFRPGKRHAALAGLAEFGGGMFFAAGFLTPLAAAAVIGVMTVAAATAHRGNGFFVSSGGWEYNLVLIATATAIACTGPGTISVDHALGIDMAGVIWGAIALAIGLAGAGVQLAMRQPQPATVDVRDDTTSVPPMETETETETQIGTDVRP